jgi:hypothetical protein
MSAANSNNTLKEAALKEAALTPTVRLALSSTAGFVKKALQGPFLEGTSDAEAATWPQNRPGFLISYVYLSGWLANKHLYCYRDWVLDSGAFSAHVSGKEISLQKYIDVCKRLRDEDETLKEVFALDVIGDHIATLRNLEEMWRQGVEAIPCYHANEPEWVLKHIADNYPKIALGGVALWKRGGQRDLKLNWAEQCFARVWPKAIHGFAFGSEKGIMALPWHSVDASSWNTGPGCFGQWQSFGRMDVRGEATNLRPEIEWYLKLEKRARVRWRKELALLERVFQNDQSLAEKAQFVTAENDAQLATGQGTTPRNDASL